MKHARSVNRALDILLEFVDQPVQSAADLQQKLVLPRPTLYRMLASLEERGLIHSFGDPRQYCLGAQIAKLSQAWSESFELGMRSQPVLATLTAATNETATLFMPYDTERRILVRQVSSMQPLSYALRQGDTMPYTTGAAGKAILAYLPAERREALLANLNAAERLKIDAALKDIQTDGYWISHGERQMGGVAIAVPVLDHRGFSVGSIALLLPEQRLTASSKEQFVNLLLEAGRALSQ